MPQLVVGQVLSGPALGLQNALDDLLVTEIGGRTVLYALSRADSSLAEVTLESSGTLVPVGSIALSGSFLAGSEPLLSTYTNGDDVSLLLAGMPQLAGAFVELDPDGTLVSQSVDNNVPELVAPVSFTLSGTPSILSGRLAGGIDLYRDFGSGLQWAAAINDTASTYLADLSDLATFTINGTQFAAASSSTENGLSVIQLGSSGSVDVVMSVGASEGLPISTPESLAVVDQSGQNYLVVASSGTSSLSTLSLDDAGAAALSDHILDDDRLFLSQVKAVDSVSVSGTAFVAAGGADGGVSLFTMLPGGRLVHLASFDDTGSTTLTRVSTISVVSTASSLQVMVGSAWETGLTRLTYDLSGLGSVLTGSGTLTGTALDDQLVGDNSDNLIDAHSGDDIILDGGGSDTLTGGLGADLFVFASDNQVDYVTDFERGQDKLDLSAFDFLYDVSQISITPTADGATLTFGTEIIEISAADGNPITAADLTTEDILNLSRPPLATVSLSLNGTEDADTLNGGSGDDTIDGAGGADVIFGQGGMDVLLGGDGADTIYGGTDSDAIDGGTGADSLIGGEGNDSIQGGAGGDIIYGDEIA